MAGGNSAQILAQGLLGYQRRLVHAARDCGLPVEEYLAQIRGGRPLNETQSVVLDTMLSANGLPTIPSSRGIVRSERCY